MGKIQYCHTAAALLGGLSALVLGSACGGDISLQAGEQGGANSSVDGRRSGNPAGIDPRTGLPSSGPAATSSQVGESNTGADPLAPIAPAPATRTARLTHAQWENSVADLLGLGGEISFASLLRGDPVQSGFMFDNDATTMAVDDALFSGYQQAASNVAEFVTADRARLDALLGSNAALSDDQAARSLITSLGLRAHRRPLTSEETDEYLALFDAAAGLYEGMSDFDAGTRLLLEAMLQSPNFLYRVESSVAVSGGVIPLGSYEIATRLSYALWNTMPDAALFEAAAADLLGTPEQVADQALRMLADPRAQSVVGRFHDQLLEVDRYAGIRPSQAAFPGLSSQFGAFAAAESRGFVREIVFGQHGGYSELLTSSQSFVNDELAELYGLSGDFGDDFTMVTLDAAQRRGLLTQSGFLALNASSVNPDPIHRGVFIARRLTCTEVPAPPANIPALPDPQGRTNRETVTAHTEAPGSVCASCHKTWINPLGFPFENFDAIGRSRTTDNGHAIDTSASAWNGSEHVAVQDALQLADELADSRAVHECYVRHWLEFAYGRPKAPQDAGLIARLGEQSHAAGLPVEELIVALVTSSAFLNRSAEELQ